VVTGSDDVSGPGGSRERGRSEPVDRARMLEMREQYGDLIAQLVDIFADTTPAALADLQSALERDDRETLRAVAHSLKGACQNVGALAMAELCRALEDDPAAAATHLPRLRAAVEPTLAALRGIVSTG
jgi:HPt (histidine-containing phosphotransfer) domain-containing protein